MVIHIVIEIYCTPVGICHDNVSDTWVSAYVIVNDVFNEGFVEWGRMIVGAHICHDFCTLSFRKIRVG
jgi:hypothetical protein